MSKKPCTYENLISTEHGNAVICHDCGIVHWHFMHMSMRFNVADFLGMADTLTQAAHNIRAGGNDEAKSRAVACPARRLN